MDKISAYFDFKGSGTDYRTELVAGVTTFMTMAYIIFVNPSILANPHGANMPFESVLVATCIASFITTLLMGIYAKYPIAAAPGMGLNAFFSFTICGAMGVPWPVALGMVFISGVVFAVLTTVGLWEKIINSVPQTLKYSTACGIGAFIAFIGLQHAGIVVSNPATFVGFGDLGKTETLLAVGGLLLTAILMVRGVRGAILIGLLITGAVGVAIGLVEFVPALEAQESTLLKLDIIDALSLWKHPEYIAPIVILLFFDMFDTVGTLIGVGEQAGFMKDGVLPRSKQSLLSDATGTMVGSIFGTSTVTSYIESAAGVSEGGRTGFANIVTAFAFLVALGLFYILRVMGLGTLAKGGAELAPITAPALIVVGTLMMTNISKIPWEDFTEALPGFMVIILMPLTYSISTGLAAGFIIYPFLKLSKGKGKEVHPLLYILAGLIIVGYVLIKITR